MAISRLTPDGIPEEATLLDTTPRMNENTAKLPAHAIRLPRWLRSACAAGEDSNARPDPPLRSGSRPLPMSLAAPSRAASHSSSALATTGSSSTAGRGPANGRISSAQPSGVAQRSQPAAPTVSATTRSRKHSPAAPPAISAAIRRLGASWLATAPMPANTPMTETVARARYAEPATGSPPSANPANSAAHSTSVAAPVAAIADR